MNAREIRLAIFGIGNCASSLVQAIIGSRDRDDQRGLESTVIGGYKLGDVRVVLAYDVSAKKVGCDLRDAMAAAPNCTTNYFDVGAQDLEVRPGLLADGLDGPLSALIKPHALCAGRAISDIESELRSAEIDVAVCYLPTGSRQDARNYSVAACRAGVAFINACPEAIMHDKELRSMFERAGVPLLGDDMKSHAGATALHTLLIEFFSSRNIHVDHTYQLNIGGNADFKNLADQARSASKRNSKRAALEGAGIESDVDILAGPTGFVPFLQDRKIAYIRLEGTSVLGMKLNIEARLDVEDSPNVVSVIADAIRIAMLTRQTPTSAREACAHLFKNPLIPVPHSTAHSAYVRLVQHLNGDIPLQPILEMHDDHDS
ncbi:myo-inositol-1-phosphate synthase [Paraburkholderia sp. PGU19]|uniref:inositol-3-phosphate synthase n=1 Tax=Paraburkholderia sp. PGU19 TaxID=2735434 RepID=UPI0015DA085D|nr:myo-inositol-1-phosphate synthase [Paraburkholderia sp. PGU19]